MALPTDVFLAKGSAFTPNFSCQSQTLTATPPTSPGTIIQNTFNLQTINFTPNGPAYIAADMCYLSGAGFDTPAAGVTSLFLDFLKMGNSVLKIPVVISTRWGMMGCLTADNPDFTSVNYTPNYPVGGFMMFQSRQLPLISSSLVPYDSYVGYEKPVATFAYDGPTSGGPGLEFTPNTVSARKINMDFDQVNFTANFFTAEYSPTFFGMSLALFSI